MSIRLAADIEAGLRSEAAARGMDVDALIAAAVKAWISQAPLPSPTPSGDRSAEMAWAASPDSRYLDKWVILEGSQVVASGSNPVQLYEQARGLGLNSPFLIFVSTGQQEPFTGGWVD